MNTSILILRKSLLLIFLSLTSQLSYANITLSDTQCNKSIEINDLSNQIILGIDNKTVYMYFSEDLRSYLNWTYEEKYLRDLNSFKDSNGEFIPVPAIYINESKVEYELGDIQRVTINDGILVFTYNKRLAVSFEDILLPSDSVLSNFSAEDLQKFFDFFYRKVN